MRTFVYDNYGCDLLRCMFAGMNMDGRAQWLLDTPGKEAISLDDYMSQEDFKEKMTLLCDEGERPSVVDVVRMLGCALRVNVNGPYNDADERLWTVLGERRGDVEDKDVQESKNVTTIGILLDDSKLRRHRRGNDSRRGWVYEGEGYAGHR